ncbi:MAG: type I restriction endonuclease subunit R [Paludibacteraceae bacterium]|nr:type I restriction endonuclease subunit R [Paludibacteraceae bacterium]
MKFTEAKLEQVFVELLEKQGYEHVLGENIPRAADEVLIEQDLKQYLRRRYAQNRITENEINSIVLRIKSLPASDLYGSNKTFMQMVMDGFLLKRENPKEKDLYIELIDYSDLDKQRKPDADKLLSVSTIGDPQASYGQANKNLYKFVNQFEIQGVNEKRIPDGIIFINGLPLVVFEFKSAIREDTTIHNAYEQLTIRYRRDIPDLFKYNAFCIISDGVNNKAGSFFAPYEFFYSWRRVDDNNEKDGIDSMFTLIEGMLEPNRLRDLVRNFIYFPDSSNKDLKIVCRYPQYFAARALFSSIQKALRPQGDGKGGTYFGATGCGKSYTMLFLTRLLMRSESMAGPTIVLITDRTDLDDQLSAQFIAAKTYIGDDLVESVESRADLRKKLRGRKSGGVFLTTIHKFNEDTDLLSERNNIVCISDEAHRSQINLDQRIRFTEQGVVRTYGFAKHLHNSLPNATYVGFTGTPVDATLDVFGPIADSYTMTESVNDEITVRIVYEGRAAKVALDNSELEKIEQYYAEAEQLGSSQYQINQSKDESANMRAILGNPKRLEALAKDFVQHYEQRVAEGSTVKGKAMFVSSTREIAYAFYQQVLKIRPEWNEIQAAEEGAVLTDKEKRELKPIEKIKLIMTTNPNDPPELYNLLGNKEYRKEMDRQFKNEKSNFKIAIVVDMWLTGFDVPFLDTMYIDKPIQRHNLIQTISRVNRKFEQKEKGLIVDYIGIKRQMNLALAQYSKGDAQNFEDIEQSLVVVRDHLDLLAKIMHAFDDSKYFSGSALEQLNTLRNASEYVQASKEQESRFMALTKRLKAAYDICVGCEDLTDKERDYAHFYFAIRAIIHKLTKGDAPDVAQMNARVREMIKNALLSDGVEEILKMGDDTSAQQDLFDDEYLSKIDRIKLPNTKIKLLQKLLLKSIEQLKRVNKIQGVDFTKKMQAVVEKYNDRSVNDILKSEVYEEIAETLTNMIWDVRKAFKSGDELGIDFEEKAFYDILKSLCIKYDFTYPEDKLVVLAKEVKILVDSEARYPDWDKRDDIKSALKVGLIMLLDEHGYPPVERDEVYKEIFEQAENFKKYSS